MNLSIDRKTEQSMVVPWGRIPLLIAGSLLLVLVILVQAWHATDRDVHRTGDIANHRLANAGLIDALNNHDYLTAIDLRNAALARDAKQRNYYLSLAGDHIRKGKEVFASLGNNINHPSVRLAYETAAIARHQLSQQRERYFQESSNRDLTRADTKGIGDLHESTRPAREEYQAAIESLRKAQDKLAIDSVGAIAIAATQQSQRLLVLAWVLSGLMLIVTGVFWRRQVRQEVSTKEREIRQLTENRTVLVREVHHRIKNHLQGLMGLIQDQQRLRRKRSNELDTLLGHVMSLVAVHGMQARSVSEEVQLAELIAQQVTLFQKSQAADNMRISVELGEAAFAISAEHAVPLALVISELLLNACKHGIRNATLGIRLQQWHDQDGAHVSISNPVAQPVNLDLENDQGLGTGLALVKSMLIDIGVLETKNHEGVFVITVLIPPRNTDVSHHPVDTSR